MGESITPPVAPRVPSVRDLHGETVTDDYAWMRDPNEPALHAYLTAERAYYDAQTRGLDALAKTLAAEADRRTPDGPEYSVAWPRDGFIYRTVIPQGSDNAQLLRSLGAGGEEQVLLDENVIAADTGFAEVGMPRAES